MSIDPNDPYYGHTGYPAPHYDETDTCPCPDHAAQRMGRTVDSYGTGGLAEVTRRAIEGVTEGRKRAAESGVDYVEALNGKIRVGDQVAFAAQGKPGGLRIGHVMGFKVLGTEPLAPAKLRVRVKIHVYLAGSGYGKSDVDYYAGVEKHNRICKLTSFS